MIERLQQLRSRILAKLPESDLKPLSASKLAKLDARHPDLPEHLRQLFTVVGVGSIGDSRYKIHALLAPDDVYDAETAAALDGVVIVGDDFAGTCDAYDTKRGWKFGSIGGGCTFERSPRRDFVEFLERRYGDPSRR